MINTFSESMAMPALDNILSVSAMPPWTGSSPGRVCSPYVLAHKQNTESRETQTPSVFIQAGKQKVNFVVIRTCKFPPITRGRNTDATGTGPRTFPVTGFMHLCCVSQRTMHSHSNACSVSNPTGCSRSFTGINDMGQTLFLMSPVYTMGDVWMLTIGWQCCIKWALLRP
jgi:hypothetical protein